METCRRLTPHRPHILLCPGRLKSALNLQQNETAAATIRNMHGPFFRMGSGTEHSRPGAAVA